MEEKPLTAEQKLERVSHMINKALGKNDIDNRKWAIEQAKFTGAQAADEILSRAEKFYNFLMGAKVQL